MRHQKFAARVPAVPPPYYPPQEYEEPSLPSHVLPLPHGWATPSLWWLGQGSALPYRPTSYEPPYGYQYPPYPYQSSYGPASYGPTYDMSTPLAYGPASYGPPYGDPTHQPYGSTSSRPPYGSSSLNLLTRLRSSVGTATVVQGLGPSLCIGSSKP
ncbi:hypothetical protein GOP47_0020553 [Adiantum capillus-veneris]|uniref:Uncharacterized protein n=1 Tax=Adiantum capillus-veneris TaxID=13818 RepID=A0A9D4U9D4_ADICA|nr:hypothetical protein GOP47_0020553 [Adiantum capillus-veneris]